LKKLNCIDIRYKKNLTYEIFLTYKCNWDCKYCCVDTHSKNDIDINLIKELLKKIKSNSNVVLSGGEVGLLNLNIINYVIQKLKEKNCKIGINTNGLFIKKYFNILKRFFKYKIYFHCSEDLKEFYLPKNNFIHSISDLLKFQNIDFLLIIDDENINRLETFLNKYKKYNLKYSIIPATNDLKNSKITTLSIKNYKRLLKFKEFMTKESKYYLINSIYLKNDYKDRYKKIIYLDEKKENNEKFF